MLKVVILPGLWGISSVSPFCLKLEAWMRMAGIEHELDVPAAPFGAPKGKLPYVVFDDGSKLGDSTLIIERLARDHGLDFEAHLDPRDKAVLHALRVMMEERLYFALVYSRWVEDDGWAQIQPVFGRIPAPMRWLVPSIARRAVRKQLWQQGIARHDRADVHAMACADIDAAAAILGERSWFGGEKPATLDATAYGFLANLLAQPWDSPESLRVREHQNLVDYVARAKAAWWKD
jgi:glutathione S-transferase